MGSWANYKSLVLILHFLILKLNGSLNAYVKKTNDLIATAVIDPFTNFGTTIDANIGDMENKGVELQLKFYFIRI